MNKQTGSVLAILVGVGILFAAATDRVGAAISALRGTSSTGTNPPVDDKSNVKDDPTGDVASTGMTKSPLPNGTARFTQTGSVR